MYRYILILTIFVFLFGCSDQSRTRSVEIYNSSGDMLGNAHFSDTEEGTEVQLQVSGFEPKVYSVHIHEYAKCEGPDFKSAGNHFNPEGKQHGRMHPEGAHIGDLPNVIADEDGFIEAELLVENATLLDEKNSLLNDGGTSIIISENPDDGMTQPSGNSGQRIACGELKLDNKTERKHQEPTDPTLFEEEKTE